MIDEEISRIVRDSQRLADEILRKNIEILQRIAKELLKYETIDSDDLKLIMKGQRLTRPLNENKRPKRNSPNRRYNSNKQTPKKSTSAEKTKEVTSTITQSRSSKLKD